MRIVDKVQFTLGIFDIIVGVGLTIAVIILHRYTKIVFTMFPVGMGIMTLCRSIETKKQRQEKEEQIRQITAMNENQFLEDEFFD
jgi:hypothetical protein